MRADLGRACALDQGSRRPPAEAQLLQLDSTRAAHSSTGNRVWISTRALVMTIDWYREVLARMPTRSRTCRAQIDEYPAMRELA